jgi:putative DNA primase/helicase
MIRNVQELCWSIMAEQARSSVRHFLEALFANKPDELLIQIWTIADKTSRWFCDVESALRYAASASGQDVYIGVGLSRRDYGPNHRCPSNEIAAIAGLWVDIDLQSDAHPQTALPCTVEEALSLLPTDLAPTFIVSTGNGIHVWLLFRDLYLFRNDEDRAAAAALSKRWNTLIRDNARARGWKIARLGDLARILRIPGTTNCKDPANPKAVVLYAHSDNRYNPDDLAKYLEDHPGAG